MRGMEGTCRAVLPSLHIGSTANEMTGPNVIRRPHWRKKNQCVMNRQPSTSISGKHHPRAQGERVSEHVLRRSLHLIVPCSWFCLQRTPLPSPLAGEGVEPPKRSEDGEAGEGVPCLALHPLGGHRGHLFFHLGNGTRRLE